MSTVAAASTASSSSSTSSPRCVPFAFRRGGARGRHLPPAPASGATARTVAHGGAAPASAAAGGCGGAGRQLCCAAEVLGGGIQSAFFTSLDRCSCVKVRTDSFKEYSESEAAPLMPSPPPPHDDSGSAAAATAARGGGRRRAAAAGKPRRGLGCCTPSSTSVN